jgi:hypothetical protein
VRVSARGTTRLVLFKIPVIRRKTKIQVTATEKLESGTAEVHARRVTELGVLAPVDSQQGRLAHAFAFALGDVYELLNISRSVEIPSYIQ